MYYLPSRFTGIMLLMRAEEGVILPATGKIHLPERVLTALRTAMPNATDEEIAKRLARELAEWFARKNRLPVSAQPDITAQTVMGKFVCSVPVAGSVRCLEIDPAEWPWKTAFM